ncbi:hypothetical protein [Bradyrhizobium sp. B120]|uniref:hypothetical protein n=1 Tax=Bradyrhizobium sp. B120 TaxID=3410088 RepID=UPI003B97D517
MGMAHKKPKPARKAVKGRRADATEFEFFIDAYSPSTIPMARLAEYMAQLATMLGEESSVHFVKLKRGSTRLVHRVQREAVPKVRERAAAVRRGDAPRDALRAYDTVNRMLREDDGCGALKEAPDTNQEAVIIPFPGVQSSEEKFAVQERGTIDGMLVRVGGIHKWVPVLIEANGEAVSGCWADRITAKKLARHLFEPVRLIGTGKWERGADGKWSLKEFVVEAYETLSNEPLSDALNRIRAINAFKDTTLDDIEMLRKGPESKNGGH